jgi:uncharacterized protein GlcG (DUF336 family)
MGNQEGMSMSRLLLAASAAMVLATVPGSQAATMMQGNVSAAQALSIVHAAIDACRDASISITVLDRDGKVRLQVRGNGANPHNLELSRRKAFTARTFRTTSAEWAKRTAPGDDLYGQRSLSDVIALGGGVPIIVNGEVIGAVGISGANGGMPREEACSKAGIAAIQGQLS